MTDSPETGSSGPHLTNQVLRGRGRIHLPLIRPYGCCCNNTGGLQHHAGLIAFSPACGYAAQPSATAPSIVGLYMFSPCVFLHFPVSCFVIF